MKKIFFIIPLQYLFSVFLFLFIFNTNEVIGQNDSTNTEVEFEYDTMIVKRKLKSKLLYQEYKKGDIDFYLSPFAILELRPTLYFGVEYFLEDKISIHTDLGYVFSFVGNQNINSVIPLPHSSHLSYVIKPEIRFYSKINPQKSSYNAIKFMFRNMNYKENQHVYDEYFFDEDTQSWSAFGDSYESDYRVRRRSIGLQYIRGWKGKIFKTWTSNFYFGAGVRYIANQPIDKRPNPFNRGWDNFNINLLDVTSQYKLVSMDFALGIRIGSKLKR